MRCCNCISIKTDISLRGNAQNGSISILTFIMVFCHLAISIAALVIGSSPYSSCTVPYLDLSALEWMYIYGALGICDCVIVLFAMLCVLCPNLFEHHRGACVRNTILGCIPFIMILDIIYQVVWFIVGCIIYLYDGECSIAFHRQQLVMMRVIFAVNIIDHVLLRIIDDKWLNRSHGITVNGTVTITM